jgi:hypothetical protein
LKPFENKPEVKARDSRLMQKRLLYKVTTTQTSNVAGRQAVCRLFPLDRVGYFSTFTTPSPAGLQIFGNYNLTAMIRTLIVYGNQAD